MERRFAAFTVVYVIPATGFDIPRGYKTPRIHSSLSLLLSTFENTGETGKTGFR